MTSKLIAVFGATGQQGGSVARALLNGGKFKVRAITRNTESDSAKALAKQGAEVVSADLDAKDSVTKVLQGAYGCFGVTNFWADFNKEKEIQQGKDLVDVCKAVGVEHLVYSGLEHVQKLTGISCPHFDGKGIVEEYLQESGVPFTVIRLAAYLENLSTGMIPQKIGDNKFALGIPNGDVPLALVPAVEIGECVSQIFNKKEEYLNKFVGLASDEKTVQQIAELMTKHLGVNVEDGKVTPEAYSKFGFPGADDLANMFKFYQSGKCVRDVKLTHSLNPNISTIEQWICQNKAFFQEKLK